MKAEVNESVLNHCHGGLASKPACLGRVPVITCLLLADSARLKSSLSMASLRDNQRASLVFTFTLFILQIHHQ